MKLLTFILAFAILQVSQFASAAAKYCVQDLPDGNYESHFSGLKPRYKRDNEVLPQYLPTYAVTANLKYPGLFFTDIDGSTYLVTKLDPGEPNNFWDIIGELEDNWIYVGNGHLHDHVIHLTKDNARQWKADKVIRLTKSGPFEWLISYLLDFDTETIRRNQLNGVLHINPNIAYSHALRKLFLLDWSKEFENGHLINSSIGYLKRYIGEVSEFEIAIFFSDDDDLYYFDGTKSAKIDGGDASEFFSAESNMNPGQLVYLEKINQTFFVSHKSIFEFAKTQTGYELRKVQLPTSEKDLFFSVLLPTPAHDDVAILTRGNIFLLSDLQGIFPRAVPDKQINTTGSNFLPVFIPDLGGILFSTGGSYLTKDKKEYFHLLWACKS